MAKEKASQEEIYRTMRQDIEGGEFPASSRLPSVRTLAKRFNASPNTISKVVSRLMESGLCSARRGVGLFVRSLPSRKLTLLTGSTSPKPGDDVYGWIEMRLSERLGAEGIEIDRVHTTADDPPYGPSLDRLRNLGRVVVTMGLNHEPHLKAVGDLHRPTLCIGHAPNRAQVSSIVPNSFRAGYLAARHLIKSGSRRIAYIGRVRRIRQVALAEAESLKELAGIQSAFIEEGMNLRHELIFPELAAVAERAGALKDMPDAVIMPAEDGVEVIQALKALGNGISRVVIGDDRILEKAKRPAAVVYRREEVADLACQEILRLLSEERRGTRSYMIDTDLVLEGETLA
ncbi:MAG: GntR family transcriptional regulator [Planctomycetota bacterium]|nr:MAG: GntR family transcriptional regulator [Planctomycetota bacterium]